MRLATFARALPLVLVALAAQSLVLGAQSTALRPMPTAPISRAWYGGSGALPLVGPMPGADVIYNNTTFTGWYMLWSPGQALTAPGVLPAPNHFTTPHTGPGCATRYLVTGIEFGYCTDQPSVDLDIEFDSIHIVCSSWQFDAQERVRLPGLPGSTTGGMQCWTITVDLRQGGLNSPFTILAAGDGTYDPPTNTGDQFAVRYRFTNHTGTNTGMIAAGDGMGAAMGLGVRWTNVGVDYSQAGDGLFNSGMIEFGAPPSEVCWDWYGYALGPYLRLFADACGTLIGEPFCPGDGSGTPCPCGNSSPALNLEGCRNSVNGVNGGRLETLGTASLAADSVLLRALRLPATASVLFFQGDQEVTGGAGAAFGDGLRCAGGSVVRIGTNAATSGQAEYPAAGDPSVSVRGAVSAPGRRYYQAWYRNAADFCTPATFNLTNGWRLDWGA